MSSIRSVLLLLAVLVGRDIVSAAVMAQDLPAPPQTSQAGGAVALPRIQVTSTSKRKAGSTKRSRPRTASNPPPALPDGVVLDGGPPVAWTTAGPVSGYRALSTVSATKTETAIERIPQSVQVIPRSVIDDQKPLTQSEALRNVSGVSGMPTNTQFGFAYKVRGFPADRYVDGLPNIFDGGDFVSLVNTERVEVLKGPGGILYAGFNPVGGIINTVSKLPTANRFSEAGVMAGGFGLWNPWFDVNQPLNSNGTALFRMTGDFERSRDYVDVIQHRRYSLDPTVTLKANDGSVLTIQGRFSARESQAYAGLPGAGTIDQSAFTIRRNLFPSTPDLPKTSTTYNGLTVRFDHEFDSIWSMNAAARINQGRLREFDQYAAPNAPVAGSTFLYVNDTLPIDSTEISANPNLVGKFSIGETKNTLLLGADYGRAVEKLRVDAGFAGFVDLANPTFPAYVAPSPGPLTSVLNSRDTIENSGLTAQLQSTVWDRVHLLGGVRFAHVRLHSTDNIPTRSTDFLTDASKPLPRIGAVVDLMRGVSVFADYTEGFRGVPFFNGAAPPKPEESKQTEAGLKLALPSGFAATLAWFTLTRRNVVTQLPGSPILAVQVGEQQSQGFEADLTWQPIAGLSILASYAHINAQVVRDQLYPAGNKIDRVPDDSGRVWANYKIQTGPLQNVSVGAGVYAASPQAVALDNKYFTPGFVTVDGKLGYDMKGWSFALVGKNLANAHYFQVLPANIGWVAPGEPRTVYVTANLKY